MNLIKNLISLVFKEERATAVPSHKGSQPPQEQNDFGVSSYERKSQIVQKYYDEQNRHRVESQKEVLRHRLSRNAWRAFKEWNPLLYDTVAKDDGLYVFICAHENHYSFEYFECHKSDRLLDLFTENPICVGDGYAFPLGFYRVDSYSAGNENWGQIHITSDDDIRNIITSLCNQIAIIAVPGENIEYRTLGDDRFGLYRYDNYLAENGSNIWMCTIPDPIALGEVKRKSQFA